MRGVMAGLSGTGGLGADLRGAVRSLRRAPWYSATVISVIALGMSLATTVFAVVDGVLFKPLPYPDSDRLVVIEPGFNDLPAPTSKTAPFVRIKSASFVDIANWQAAAPDVAITGFRASRWSGFGESTNEPPYGVGEVQPNFFDTVGVRPLTGGLAAADFDSEDLLKPVIITYETWRGRFHGVSDVIGQTYINDPTSGRGFRVAGVMPRGFVFPSDVPVSFIAPFVAGQKSAHDPTRRIVHHVVARLPRGMSIEPLRARVEAALAVTAAAFPARGPKPPGWSDRGWRMEGPYDRADVTALTTALGRKDLPLFSAVFVAAIVLLVLGGLNVSGLMVARGLDRARELGLRRALGASGFRIASLVFVEALVPILIGAVAGLALAEPLLQIGIRLLPEELVLLKTNATPSIDARVVVFVALSAIALAVPTTIWPIRRALRIGAVPLLDGSRGSTRTRSVGRLLVVVSQIAGALVLTVGGALLMTSILTVYGNVPAIRTDRIVALREEMQGGDGPTGSPARTARIKAVIAALRRVPGVDGVAVTDGQVLDGGGGVPWWTAPPGDAASRLPVVAEAVTPDFYRVLQPQLVTGRFPTDVELQGDAPVIVVSESVARAYWPNASPLGQTLNYQRVAVPFVVVGVVKDVRWNQWDVEVGSIYGPYARISRDSFPTIFIHTGSVGRVTSLAVQAIAAVDPLIRTSRSGTFDEWFADSVRPRRFQSWLFGSFALAALVIVGVGILGLMAMATARRTREMGIRLALGATRDSLIGLLLREQLRAVVAGVIAGGLVSAWAVRFVKAYLYEITPYDPRVWAAAIVVIVLTAAAGTLIPALRASRVDPVNALRVD